MLTKINVKESNVGASEINCWKTSQNGTSLYLLDLCRERHHSVVDDFFIALVTSGLGFGIVVVVNEITVVRSGSVSGSILGGSGKGHGLQIVRGTDHRFHVSDDRLRARINSIKT